MCTPPPDWELHTDLQHQPIVFRTTETKKHPYNSRPYNYGHTHLDEWTSEQESQESDDDSEMYSITGFSPSDSNRIPIEKYEQQRKSFSRPLMGEIKPISELGRQQWSTRLEQFTCSALEQKFSSYRPVLVHDSSGWQALAFSYFEILLCSRSKIEIDQEISRLLSLNNLVKTAGQYDIGLIKDMINETISLLKDLSRFKENSLRTASILLLQRFNHPGVSDAIICHFRLIASSWLVANSANYQSYIPEGLTVETYRNRWLNAPHREIDGLAMRLLVDVLLRPLNDVEFDVTCIEEGETTTHCIYPTISADLKKEDLSINNTSIHLLHRSNHYDILYKKDHILGEGEEKELEGDVTSANSFEPSYRVFDFPSPKFVSTFNSNQLDDLSLLCNLRLSDGGIDSIYSGEILNRPIYARTATIRKTFEPQHIPLDITGLSNIVGLGGVQSRRNSLITDQQSREKDTDSATASVMKAGAQISGSAVGDLDQPQRCATNAQVSELEDDSNSLPKSGQPITQEIPLELATGSLVKEQLDSYDESEDDCEIDWEEEDLCDKEEFGNIFQGGSDVKLSHSSQTNTIKSFLERVKDELLDCLMNEFWDIANRSLMSNIRTHGSTSEPSSPSENNGSPRKQLSSFTYGKRPLEDGNDEPSEQDRERGPKKPKSTITSTEISDEPPHFACPYRKHDPRKYNVNQWGACALNPQKGVSRVKSHLYRHHRIYQCKRCKSLFKTQPEIDTHIIAPEGCTVKEFDPEQLAEGITEGLMKKLQSRKKLYPDQTEAERWQQIYQLLFPNEIVPDPYFEPVRDLEEDTYQVSDSLQLEEFLRREVPRIFRILLDTNVGNALQTIEEQLKNRLLGLLEEAQNHALTNYHSTFRGTIGTLTMPSIAESQYSDLEQPASNSVVETSYQFASSQSETFMQSETHHLHASFDSGSYNDSWRTSYSQQISAEVAGNDMNGESFADKAPRSACVGNSGLSHSVVWQLEPDINHIIAMGSLNPDFFEQRNE